MLSNKIKSRFGARVVELRKSKKWSQEALSHESGLARSYLGGVESGKRNLSLINICRLALALGVPLPVLMDFPFVDEDEPAPLVRSN